MNAIIEDLKIKLKESHEKDKKNISNIQNLKEKEDPHPTLKIIYVFIDVSMAKI